MPTPEYHARLGPSSADRWLHCPASVSMSASIPSSTSVYAEAGRVAHAIAELKARHTFLGLSKRTYNSQLKKLRADEHYSSEMEGYTDKYIEVLEEHAMTFPAAPFLALETSVPIGQFTGEVKASGEPASGTADCIQIGGDTLWISDYKNGSGVPVEADNNPQMMMYALGALYLYAPVYGNQIQRVKMTIIQPALHSVTNFEIPRTDLEAWGMNVLVPGAAKAHSDNPGDPVPGSWCKFCPARHKCRERANANLALEAFGQGVPLSGTAKAAAAPESRLLSDAEIGEILTRGENLASWLADLKDYALQACLHGAGIPGFKAVEGRGSRVWADTDAAFKVLTEERDIPEALLWERKPVTVPALEKALGKKPFAAAAEGLVTVKPGKPTLVPETDKRPPYNAATIAFGGGGGNG